VEQVPRTESPNKVERIIDTRSLRALLLEAGVDAIVTARVMVSIDEYLARPECPPLKCFLVKPEALALSEECIADFYRDIIEVLGGKDW